MKYTLSVLLIFLSMKLIAQVCDYFPADCPDAGGIEASNSASVRSQNGLTAKEIAMQDRMRSIAKEIMQSAADGLGWQLVEIDEVTNLNPLQSGGTPDPLRSPRAFGIEFELIVNSDSLQLWKEWLIDFSNRYKDASLTDINNQQDVANSPPYKQYGDSVNRYMKLYTDYVTAHQNEGAQLFTDPKVKQYQDKQKEFTDKQIALVNSKEAQKNSNRFENEKAQRTKQFRTASTVEIFFQFNPVVGTIHSSDGTERVNDYNLPGSFFAKSVHIAKADPYTTPWLFDQWENMTVLLFGKWLQTPDQYKNYDAIFKLNGQSDEHTPKKTLSDKVQTIAVHVMGSKTNMEKFINKLDVNKLNAAVDK